MNTLLYLEVSREKKQKLYSQIAPGTTWEYLPDQAEWKFPPRRVDSVYSHTRRTLACRHFVAGLSVPARKCKTMYILIPNADSKNLHESIVSPTTPAEASTINLWKYCRRNLVCTSDILRRLYHLGLTV